MATTLGFGNSKVQRVSVFYFYFFVLCNEPTNAQLIDQLLCCSYMFRHYRVILRQLVINTLLSYTSMSNVAVGNTILLFCTMTNKRTIISQIIALPHVSTLSCHRQTACNQYLVKLHKYVKCSCWQYNLKFHTCFMLLKSRCLKSLNYQNNRVSEYL
jgi:hypothetical protein